jgi:Protein of unknown function (DUF429)
MTAMRCADILARYHERHDVPLDRVNDPVVEVYPAAALVGWGFDVRGYKAPAANDRRRTILDGLTTAAGLCLDQEMVARCTASDHCLDALVCALVARAHALNLTHAPAPAHRQQVAREGWIHLPVSDSLARLTR